MDDKLPVSSKITIKAYETIFHSEEWWKFASRQVSFGREEVAVYLFKKTDKKWKRKQKMVFRSSDEWKKAKEAVEKLIGEHPLT